MSMGFPYIHPKLPFNKFRKFKSPSTAHKDNLFKNCLIQVLRWQRRPNTVMSAATASSHKSCLKWINSQTFEWGILARSKAERLILPPNWMQVFLFSSRFKTLFEMENFAKKKKRFSISWKSFWLLLSLYKFAILILLSPLGGNLGAGQQWPKKRWPELCVCVVDGCQWLGHQWTIKIIKQCQNSDTAPQRFWALLAAIREDSEVFRGKEDFRV